MRIEITGHPVFHIPMTYYQATLIQCCAIDHYDTVCRNSAMAGGFVYGWVMSTEPDKTNAVSATFLELDLVCKILEMGSLFDFKEALRLRQAFMRALSHSNEVSRKWAAAIETKETPK